ncbi:phenylalanyl-tRNA synthetase beta subunit [Tindallia magadiensis]|uniref:Phenylalanine--tRNA ligase beta subunit n=1 Tax=Tindallia magadiensis TaxID=69895 RepID=A0A1I3B932_9FIRM|nr:phenylalanine--tRNA ligase subunit beta [Tindallia magadiensis]SFH58680.1 phenylalanyl-tRNA synthetase beta subunit [Tindallia magadiensis]
MLVPVKWLKEYVNVNVDVDELADKMTMSGSNVEEVKRWGEGLDRIIVGKITKIDVHPRADKLVIAQVTTGNKTLQIVTGAQNIEEGNLIPIAVEGTKLPNGMVIEETDFRGELSQGMMCSPDELGIPKHMIPEEFKDGIWILDPGAPIGAMLTEVIPVAEKVIEFEITSNRPDCLSVLGLARETAATLDTETKFPVITLKEEGVDWKKESKVAIEDLEGCSRYTARRISNVKIGPSPQWMQQRLIQAGIRPISNVVDITNYVMLETGQPLHAFDADKIKDQHIIVRQAKDGEVFKTLDGVERNLTSEMTLIADSQGALGIAGVMGGEESEVTKDTHTIILESANFNQERIRKTSQLLGLRTEASSRFEKGMDPEGCLLASNRACQLMEELGVGVIDKGVLDEYPNPVKQMETTLRPDRVNALLGTDLSVEEMVKILNKLEIQSKVVDDKISLTVPTFRKDLQQEADFIEEIGRIYGFDKIKPTLMKGDIMVGGLSERQKMEERIKDALISCGCFESLTYSFVSPSSVDAIRIAPGSFKRDFVKLLNPLGDETSVMRTTIVPNMMEVMARNIHRNVTEGRLFEIGNVFYAKMGEENALPLEVRELVIGSFGKEEDFFTLKGVVQFLLAKIGINEVVYESETNHPTYHPGRCATIYAKGKLLGNIGEIHPKVGQQYDLDKERCYIAELNADLLLDMASVAPQYKALPKYPSIVRDLALVLEETIPVKAIEDILKEHGGEWMESFQLFDIYQGDQIGKGLKSVAYTMTFRHPERTLKDGEVDKIAKNVVKALEESTGAKLRA